MIDLQELWIGDELIHRVSLEKGRFEGLSKDGFVLFRTQHNIKKFKPEEIEKLENLEIDPELPFLPEFESKATVNPIFRNNIIDLHIETLAPHLINSAPERILLYQMEIFNQFLSWAIKQKYYSVQIIHGKGTGVLREEIRSILNFNTEIKIWQSIHQDGATEVWLK